jgi:two-component system OmpR family response regulator
VVTRVTLEQHIWDLTLDSGSNVMDVHLKNLRAKLGEENRDLIQTIRGKGYRMAAKSTQPFSDATKR